MKQPRVFIVEDDRDFAEGLALLLNVEGYEVTIAFSGEEAVEIFKHQDFDITFMDVRLPGMNGVESFFEIRKLKPGARVMMMTAYSVEQLLREAINGGALGVLNKPLNPEKILEMLKTVKPAGVILLADDDPDFLSTLEMLLSKSNYKVLLARTGQETVEKVLENDINVLILDLNLPLLSGLEVYLELKRQGRTLPTLIVTGYAGEEANSIDKLKEISVAGCLIKPFAPEVLLSAIEVLMKKPDGKISENP